MDRVLFLFRTESKAEMLYKEVCMLLFLPLSRTAFVTPVMYVFFFPLLKCVKHTDHIALIIELLGKVPRKLIVAGKYSKEFFTKKGKINVLVPRHYGSKVFKNEKVSAAVYMLPTPLEEWSCLGC